MGCFVRKETTAKLHISLQNASRAEDLTAWPCQIAGKERRGGKKGSRPVYDSYLLEKVEGQTCSLDAANQYGAIKEIGRVLTLYSKRPPAPSEERGIPAILEQCPACRAFHSGTRATWNRNSLISEIREFKAELVFSAVISQQAPAAEFAAVCVCVRVFLRVRVCSSHAPPLQAHCVINVSSSLLFPLPTSLTVPV